MRPCLGCGEPSEPTRCPDCSSAAPVHSKGTARERGYDTAHDRLSRRARKLQPFCSECGTTDDLQLHHTPEAWERKAAGKAIRLCDVVVLCGPCNRAAGPARGRTARGDAPPAGVPGPPSKAKFESEIR